MSGVIPRNLKKNDVYLKPFSWGPQTRHTHTHRHTHRHTHTHRHEMCCISPNNMCRDNRPTSAPGFGLMAVTFKMFVLSSTPSFTSALCWTALSNRGGFRLTPITVTMMVATAAKGRTNIYFWIDVDYVGLQALEQQKLDINLNVSSCDLLISLN